MSAAVRCESSMGGYITIRRLMTWPLARKPHKPKRSFWRLGYLRTATNPRGAHFAIDIPEAEAGDVVICPESAIFIGKGYDRAAGNWITLRGGSGIVHRFFHLAARPDIAVGETCNRGRRLARQGCTGWCEGVHVHWECHYPAESGTGFLRRDPRIDPWPLAMETWEAERWIRL